MTVENFNDAGFYLLVALIGAAAISAFIARVACADPLFGSRKNINPKPSRAQRRKQK